jgi:hypothetical protein
LFLEPCEETERNQPFSYIAFENAKWHIMDLAVPKSTTCLDEAIPLLGIYAKGTSQNKKRMCAEEYSLKDELNNKRRETTQKSTLIRYCESK